MSTPPFSAEAARAFRQTVLDRLARPATVRGCGGAIGPWSANLHPRYPGGKFMDTGGSAGFKAENRLNRSAARLKKMQARHKVLAAKHNVQLQRVSGHARNVHGYQQGMLSRTQVLLKEGKTSEQIRNDPTIKNYVALINRARTRLAKARQRAFGTKQRLDAHSTRTQAARAKHVAHTQEVAARVEKARAAHRADAPNAYRAAVLARAERLAHSATTRAD